jgi:sarcosine oxidase subunit beta
MTAGLQRETDVVVVGGGIVGVACAYYLARAGQRVIVVEKDLIAGGASGRNGGHLSPTIDGAWAPLAQLALDTWPELVDEIDGPTEYCRAGGLYILVAHDPIEPVDRLAYRRERGFVAELVSAEDCRGLLPGLAADIKGGVLSPRHGQVNPVLTARSLGHTAARLGVQFLVQTEVTGVLVRDDVVEGVHTTAGEIAAPVVVNAAGPWAAELARMVGIDCPVTPRRIQILLSEPLPPMTQLIWGGNGLYARQAHAGHLHFGSAGPAWDSPVEGFDRRLSPATMQHTAHLMLELMPALGEMRILRSWSGTIGPTPDGTPILEACASPRGFILATGFGGNGFVTAPAVGKVVADLVARGRTGVDIAGVRLERFSHRSLY